MVDGRCLKVYLARLSLTIEGHTDDVGNAAANEGLSERRVELVRR